MAKELDFASEAQLWKRASSQLSAIATKLFLDWLVLDQTPSGWCDCLHWPLTLPAGANSQLHVNLRGVDGPVVGDQVGFVGHPVHVERHHGELHVDDVVVPLLITDLTGRKSSHISMSWPAFLCSSPLSSQVYPPLQEDYTPPHQPLAGPHLPL